MPQNLCRYPPAFSIVWFSLREGGGGTVRGLCRGIAIMTRSDLMHPPGGQGCVVSGLNYQLSNSFCTHVTVRYCDTAPRVHGPCLVTSCLGLFLLRGPSSTLLIKKGGLRSGNGITAPQKTPPIPILEICLGDLALRPAVPHPPSASTSGYNTVFSFRFFFFKLSREFKDGPRPSPARGLRAPRAVEPTRLADFILPLCTDRLLCVCRLDRQI